MNKYYKQITICILTIFICFQTNAQETNLGYGHFLDGIKNYNMDNSQEAIKCFEKAIIDNPSNDAAYYYLGLCYSEVSDIDHTEVNLLKATELDPSNYWYRITLAELYSQTDRKDMAVKLYEELTTDFPKKSSIYYDIIELYTSAGEIDKALETLDTIEKVGGENEATINARFDLLRMQGNIEDAEKVLKKITTDYPSPRSYYLMGEIAKSRYQDSTAIASYNQAIKMDPKFSPAYFGLAEVYMIKRQFNLYFDNINIFLASPEMNVMMKSSYIKEMVFNPQFVQTFLPQVDTMIANVVKAHPKDSSALFLAGTYNLQTARQEEGVEFYKQIYELYPSDSRATIEYISVLYYRQDWERLIVVGEQVLKNRPEDIYITEILGSAYWQAGNIDKAIDNYTNLLKYNKDNEAILLSAYSALGDLHHIKGQNSKTYAYYNKALKINPDHLPVLNNYAYYLSLENKKLKKAYQMSKKTILREPDNSTYLDTYGWILYLLGEYEDARNQFKHAMLYGGKDSAAILEHYGDVLFALKEYDLAFLYWEQADKADPTLNIKEKISQKKLEL